MHTSTHRLQPGSLRHTCRPSLGNDSSSSPHLKHLCLLLLATSAAQQFLRPDATMGCGTSRVSSTEMQSQHAEWSTGSSVLGDTRPAPEGREDTEAVQEQQLPVDRHTSAREPKTDLVRTATASGITSTDVNT